MTHRDVMYALSGLLLAMFVAMLSSTVVSTALPRIVAALGGSESGYTWVVVATLLTMTATTPIWGKFADLFSKKALTQIAMLVYVVGSFIAGLAADMGVLIGARLLQGVGMGGLTALVQIVIASMVTARERGRYFGYLGAVFAIATVSGPLIGGFLVDAGWLGDILPGYMAGDAWRWCFYVGIPFAVAFFGAMLLFPTFFIEVRGETALGAGLLLAPQGLGAMLTMPIAGRLTDKRGPGWFVLGGIVLISAGMAVFTQLTPTMPLALILGALFVIGMGMGMTMMPIMTAALASLTHDEVARGSTLMNIVQRVAGSIGTAVLSVILTNELLDKPAVQLVKAAAADHSLAPKVTPQILAQVPGQMSDAFSVTFVVALVLIATCILPALLLSRKPTEDAPADDPQPDTTAREQAT